MPTPPRTKANRAPIQSAIPPLPSVSAESEEAHHFRATLYPDGTRLNWTIVRVPFNVHDCWKDLRRLRVCGEINGIQFRTSLFPAPAGQQGHTLLINKTMQVAAGVCAGKSADFVLLPDRADRPAALPTDLIAAFEGDRQLQHWAEDLSESTRREIGKWLDGVKTPETRSRRVRQMAERLLSALEGEAQTPPILEALFARNTAARSGWLALTEAQRRSHLLGIFYYQSPEAQRRRAEKAVADALTRTSS